MKLEKAIEVATFHQRFLLKHKQYDTADAIKLLIEAGKDYLESSSHSVGILLPGETRETED